MKLIIVVLTGASVTIYAVNLLQHLHRLPDVEVH
ncbi:3-octaprenyl-4-hydroxybenzoate carboxy-lyase, partial [Lacticaseibacillus rhamnosus]